MSPTIHRDGDFTAVIVGDEFVASVSANYALDWQGHCARFGWFVVDEVAGRLIGEYRSLRVAEATASDVARRYLPVAA